MLIGLFILWGLVVFDDWGIVLYSFELLDCGLSIDFICFGFLLLVGCDGLLVLCFGCGLCSLVVFFDVGLWVKMLLLVCCVCMFDGCELLLLVLINFDVLVNY